MKKYLMTGIAALAIVGANQNKLLRSTNKHSLMLMESPLKIRHGALVKKLQLLLAQEV